MRSPLIACLLCACAAFAADDQEEGEIIYKDRIYKRSGGSITCMVLHEGLEEVTYRFLGASRKKTDRWSRIREIRYQGMGSGYYQAGLAQLQVGNYDAAAENFINLANRASANREWEGAYGYYKGGKALESAGRYKQAAAAFANFIAKYPEHRWYMNAMYYRGVNLARIGETATAKQVAEELVAYNERKEIRVIIGSAGKRRAIAIQAAIAAAEEDMDQAQLLSMKVVFPKEETEITLHWKSFWASFLLEQEEYNAALQAFQELSDLVTGDPLRAAEAALGYGLALANSGRPEGAILEFLKLDVLPTGTPEQRCKAQFEAARLLWKQAEKADPTDAKAKEFADSQRLMCKQLLKSAINSPASVPEKEKAQFLMNEYFPPPPTEEAEGEGADDATGDADAAAPTVPLP